MRTSRPNGYKVRFDPSSRALALRLRLALIGDEIETLEWKKIEGILCHHIALSWIETRRGISALSLAEMTGYPRETVRRSLHRLVDAKYLARDENGLFIPGQHLNERALPILERFIDELLKTAERIREIEMRAPEDEHPRPVAAGAGAGVDRPAEQKLEFERETLRRARDVFKSLKDRLRHIGNPLEESTCRDMLFFMMEREAAGHPAQVAEIAEEFGLTESTTLRFLSYLFKARLVKQKKGGRRTLLVPAIRADRLGEAAFS